MQHIDIAKMVTKVGGGHPSGEAIRKLREHFDEDPDWYPGKGVETGKRPGPKARFTSHKERCVAECAMAIARRGEDVTVEAVQVGAQQGQTAPRRESARRIALTSPAILCR